MEGKQKEIHNFLLRDPSRFSFLLLLLLHSHFYFLFAIATRHIQPASQPSSHAPTSKNDS